MAYETPNQEPLENFLEMLGARICGTVRCTSLGDVIVLCQVDMGGSRCQQVHGNLTNKFQDNPRKSRCSFEHGVLIGLLPASDAIGMEPAAHLDLYIRVIFVALRRQKIRKSESKQSHFG